MRPVAHTLISVHFLARVFVRGCVRACVQVVASDVSPLMALHTEEK